MLLLLLTMLGGAAKSRGELRIDPEGPQGAIVGAALLQSKDSISMVVLDNLHRPQVQLDMLELFSIHNGP